MNLNNLEDRKEEMTSLGADPKVIEKMEELMRKGLPLFNIHEAVKANRGQVDVVYHFQQSKQSDAYYLNRFTVAHNLAKPLEAGKQYIVITPPQVEGGKNDVKKLDYVTEAIELFKKRGGNCELAIGTGAANKVTVATMENGKVNYVAKDFRGTFYGKPAMQTIFPDRGRGFTVPQSAQMIQGYAVLRDDLVNFTSGVPYEAWVKYDMDKGVGANGNFNLQQFHVPQYGFDLSKVLDKYNIKEFGNPAERERIENEMKNGYTPLVTVEKDGQAVKLRVEAAPRFSTVNFFTQDNRMEKREQFLTAPAKDNLLTHDKQKEKEVVAEQGLSR